MLGEVEVELRPDQSVVLRGGTRLAGSALKMHRAIANVMRLAGVTLPEAITMATTNPARVGRIASRVRGLTAGQKSDVVVFRRGNDGAIHVLETWLDGRRVFQFA